MRIKSKISQADFNELVRPKLKLFLSVDVVGSTSFKQRDRDEHAQTWLNLFVSFFVEFPTLLNTEVETLNIKLPKVRLWKSLGDELIFTVELTDRHYAAAYLKAFSVTLRKAAENWHTDDSDPARKELHLKGTAWLAGFPVGNVEIPLDVSVDDQNSDGRDYIGPLIDTGFRLKEFASSRKLVLSADLTYLLLSVGVSGMELFLEGENSLKGVLRGKPYPVIWLDCDGHPEAVHDRPSAKMNRLKDGLTGKAPAKAENLKTYLKLWLEDAKSCLCIPFIFKDPFADLSPLFDYNEKLERAKADLQRLFYVQDESKSLERNEGSLIVPKEAAELLDSLALLPTKMTKGKQRQKKLSE
jgi:hypothetical protein